MTKAEEIFSRVPRTHNCAQAVAAGADRDDLVDELRAYGGGRAPGGLCGALYAALLILPEDKREEARAEFIRLAGSDQCRVIKSECGTSCLRCVEIGGALSRG